jgi:hypothetical protein
MEIFREWDLQLDVDQVLRGQGADPAVIRERSPALARVAEWALVEGLPLLQPVVLARDLVVEKITHEKLKLEGGATLSGSLIIQHLVGAQRIVVLLCTIGSQLEEVVSELIRSDAVLGLALDGVGTAAVEALATQASSMFEERARAQGWQTSIPLSPGMLGWEVDPGQRQVFALLDAAQAGVQLTSSYMMSPNKSLTLVLGMGENLTTRGRTCDYCSLKETCRYQDHYPVMNLTVPMKVK